MRDERQPRLRVAIDAGGTFTDLVMADDDVGQLSLVKVPSTPADPAAAVFDALAKAAATRRWSLEELLAGLRVLVVGTTVATNMMVEHRGSKVGLLCTEGFRDTLAIRRGLRRSMWDFRSPHPTELVPRHRRRGVRERIDARGTIGVPLDEADVGAHARAFQDEGVEAVAVCFFNAFLDGEHETKAGQVLAKELPGAFVSLSSELLPVMGEYERTSTTVINAYVGPRTVRYLSHLAEELERRGLRVMPAVMQSNGGILDLGSARQRPAGLILSGPAGGAPAAVLYAAYCGAADVVFFDMGGTSTDVMLVSGGRVPQTERLEIEGYHLSLPAIDIKTSGTGGGTIASVDAGGLLRVGPESAGAVPGPVCYGNGGIAPTVTDANLVLRRLNPARFLGGEILLDVALATKTIDTEIASRLGVDAVQAALAIVRVANQHMTNAIRLAAAHQGADLRRFTLVAAGGASGLHVVALARELQIARVYVPRHAAVACAVGMLHTDVRKDYVQTFFAPLAALRVEDLADRFSRLTSQAMAELLDGGLAPDDRRCEASVDLRYAGQQWQITIPVALPLAAEDVASLAEHFHARHEELYGHHDAGGTIEVLKLRVVGVGLMPKLLDAAAPVEMSEPATAQGTREVWFAWSPSAVETSVYHGERLRVGARVVGPAVIEEPTTTILLDRGDTAVLDARGNYVVDLARA